MEKKSQGSRYSRGNETSGSALHQQEDANRYSHERAVRSFTTRRNQFSNAKLHAVG